MKARSGCLAGRDGGSAAAGGGEDDDEGEDEVGEEAQGEEEKGEEEHPGFVAPAGADERQQAEERRDGEAAEIADDTEPASNIKHPAFRPDRENGKGCELEQPTECQPAHHWDERGEASREADAEGPRQRAQESTTHRYARLSRSVMGTTWGAFSVSHGRGRSRSRPTIVGAGRGGG